jgi:hypothetical protein
MSGNKVVRLAVLAFSLVGLMSASALGQSGNPQRTTAKPANAEEVIDAALKAAGEGDWASAESNFREAKRLEPNRGLWRVQLTLALGQQKKWKEAFAELDATVKLGAADWVLTINPKLPDGKVAFINTDIFGDDKQGIARYVKAVKEGKKVDSVAKDIGVKLDAFAKQNNLALIYDISRFKDMPFESGKTLDATTDFIAFYNALYQKK